MDKPKFTARTPVDLIALAPVVLGFHPEDSIVLLTFGGSPGRQFHARVDLPVSSDDLDAVRDVLVDPVRRHGIESGALLIYSDDSQLALGAALVLAPALQEAGCSLADVLRVDEDCYHRPLDPDGSAQPYDISTHEFTAQAVFLGRQTLPSRSQLADRLVGGTMEEIEEVRQAAAAGAEFWSTRAGSGHWVRQVIDTWLHTREPLTVAECGTFLHLIAQIRLRDSAWELITPDTCGSLTEFWIHLLRRCPDELLPAPASMLAFSAWLAGEGALAWCAVDRCLGEDPDYSLGHLLGSMLERAVPPDAWRDSPAPRSA